MVSALLRKASHKLLRISVLATAEKAVFFHVGCRVRSVWGDEYVAATPDRESYYANLPMQGDAMHSVNVQAAPTGHFYSVFQDDSIEKFQNLILKRGRGDLAHSLMNDTLRHIKLTQLAKYHRVSDDEKKDIEINPLVIFHQAIQNASPAMGLQQAVKAGAVFQVPCPLSEKKKFFVAAGWFLSHCRSGKPKTPLSERLAKELLLAYNNEGAAVKRKQDLHRQVIASRAYIHLRWT